MNTEIAEFSIITPEQTKIIKPAVMVMLSMIPQSDPELTAYLKEILRTNKLEQQNNTFWFRTPENPGRPEDHASIQTRILKELFELKEREKVNPQQGKESRTEFL